MTTSARGEEADIPEQGANDKRVVLLCAPGRSSQVVYHALADQGWDVVVIQETPMGRGELVRRRLKRLGLLPVAGQLAFQVGISPGLARAGRARYAEILREAGLNDAPIPTRSLRSVTSVNADDARAALAEAAPRVVVVNGTRIISQKTLRSVTAPFLNMHAGITPAYRGVHGGFWALADGRPDLAGTTVHYVDEGIDTGNIIAQARIGPGPTDNFSTYPALQLVAGIPLMIDAVRALLAGQEPRRQVIPSEHAPLRYHPTILQYLRARFSGRAR